MKKRAIINTQLLLWLEPLVMDHARCNERVFFNCIIEGDYSKLEQKELDKLISGKIVDDIMYHANIDSNWDFGVLTATITSKKPVIEITKSPEKVAAEKKVADENKVIDKRIAKIVNSKKEMPISKKNMEILDNGKIKVTLPDLRINDTIDFPKIWAALELNFIDKIKEGDTVVLADEHGNKIFEMRGGSFLNIGIADLSVYDKKKKAESTSMFSSTGLKGGLFLRDDGSLDIGDFDRTFYLRIHTNNLLKSSLKLNKSFNELTFTNLLEAAKTKLLPPPSEEKEEK